MILPATVFLLWFCFFAVPHFNVLCLVLVILTAQIAFVTVPYGPSSLLSALLHITLCVVSCFFVTSSLLCLYLSFEASLIPVFFIISLFGYQPEKVAACF